MQRKFNYTGRKKIARPRVSVSLKTDKSGYYTFEAALDLAKMGLPAEASVFVEAYYRTAYMRFNFGTVGRISPPRTTLLEHIEEGLIPLFRVKVVKSGKILAAADRVSPGIPEDEEKEKTSLLPVEFRDTGDTVWTLEMDDAPVLVLNNRIEGIREAARSEPAFLSLVYPEVIRQIFKAIMDTGYSDDDSDWENRWVTFALGLGMPVPPEGAGEADEIEKSQWVEDAADAFAKKIKAREILAGSFLGQVS